MITREAVELWGRFNAHAGRPHSRSNLHIARVLGLYDIVVDPKDASVAPHLMTEGFWEAWITTWVLNNIEAESTFVDVGANTGYYSLMAAAKGAKTFAYEPNPDYVTMLLETSLLNPFPFTVRPFAVADKSGTLTLTVPADYHGSASVVDKFEGWTTVTHEVKTVSLDGDLGEIVRLDKPLIVKIDAEKAEELVWGGMQELLANMRSEWAVMLEYTPNSYSDTFIDELFACGDVSYINFAGQEESASREYIESQTDWTMLVIRRK